MACCGLSQFEAVLWEAPLRVWTPNKRVRERVRRAGVMREEEDEEERRSTLAFLVSLISLEAVLH